MPTGERVEVPTHKIVRSYLSVIAHPFTDDGFTLAMYRVARILRASGLEVGFGFRGEVSNDEGTLGQGFYSQELEEALPNHLLTLLHPNTKEGRLWWMTKAQRRTLDESIKGREIEPPAAELVADTLRVVAFRVHRESLAFKIGAHPRFDEYLRTRARLEELTGEIFRETGSLPQ